MADHNDFNQQIISEFRANEGKVGGGFEGAPMVIITTTGAKTGKQRENPLVCLPGDGDDFYIFASAAGAPKDPDWYRNLVANPIITVERGTEKFEATASTVTGAKRDEIYAAQEAIMPGFTEYKENAGRVIPVVAVHPN